MDTFIKTLQAVAEAYGISAAELEGGTHAKAVEARQLTAYLCVELTGYAFGVDRITKINTCHKIMRDMDANPEFKAFVENILNCLKKARIAPKYEFANSLDILKSNRSIEIAEREAYILSKYRKGVTFKKIASAIKVTPTRTRQILLCAFRKEFDQKLLSGFITDFDEYVNYEIDLHNKLRHLLGNQQVERSLKKSVNTTKKWFLLRALEAFRTAIWQIPGNISPFEIVHHW